MIYEKAAVRRARVAREWPEQKEQDDRAPIVAVIAEFGGDTDASAALTKRCWTIAICCGSSSTPAR